MSSWKGALTKVWREMGGDTRTELAGLLFVPSTDVTGSDLSLHWEREYIRATHKQKSKKQEKEVCYCRGTGGKKKKGYSTKESATVKASRYSKGLYLRVYECPTKRGTYHLTKERR